ncbi:MAG: hypothetical protein ACFFD4_04620 [Candidatus Odinarchaeota archaeon]
MRARVVIVLAVVTLLAGITMCPVTSNRNIFTGEPLEPASTTGSLNRVVFQPLDKFTYKCTVGLIKSQVSHPGGNYYAFFLYLMNLENYLRFFGSEPFIRV